MQQRKAFNYLFFWKNKAAKPPSYTLRGFLIFGFTFSGPKEVYWFCPSETRSSRNPPPRRITTHSFKKKGPACLGEQSGLLRSIHAPIMCRLTKAEAASKSLMQNLCSCGCFSGWKNQYCGSDARRWLSALWLTVKAKRDWGATFTVLEMERSRVCLIVEFTFNFNFIVAYFGSSEDFKTLCH